MTKIIDKDLALMTTVKTVFSKSYHLLCRFHIQKNVCRFHVQRNVKAMVKMYVQPKEAWDYACDTLLDCPTVNEFDERLTRFEFVCKSWPMFIEYVKDTWVTLHKEKFVKAWTDQVPLLGNTTTNR